MVNKEKNKIKKIKKTKILNFLVIILSVCILLFSNTSFAKGIAENIINISGNIEKPIISILEDEKVEIINIEDIYIYKFQVSNFDENQNINSISAEYSIEILRKYDNVSEYTLYIDDIEIEVINDKTEYFKLKTGEKESNYFRLEVKYNKDEIETVKKELVKKGKSQEEIEEIIYNYEIKLNVIQIDK